MLMRPTHTARHLVIGLSAAAGGAAFSTALAQSPQAPPPAAVVTHASASVDCKVPPAEADNVTALIDAATQVMRSPEFAANVAALEADYLQIFEKADAPPTSLANVSARIFKHQPSGRFVPALVQATGSESYDMVFTGSDPVNWSVPMIQIGRAHFSRFSSADVVERSCAINTMVHELLHTLSSSTSIYAQALTDIVPETSKRPGTTEPIASYLLGSLAQCTYLQTAGRINADGLRQCIAVFGAREFNNARCDDFNDPTASVE